MAAKFKACSVSGCNGNSHRSKGGARGFCGKHYYRVLKYGDPLFTKSAPNGEPKRFFDEVVSTFNGDECLIWPYASTAHGYGLINLEGKNKVVSRLACEEEHGPPPSPDHEAAHSCGNGNLGCVNKTHVRWATPYENSQDKILHGTTARGASNAMAVLDEIKVLEIMSLKGAKKQREIAKLYGVSPSTVSMIHRREVWSWLQK